ncbi:hypothetical protein ACQZV8_08875 [Magnetococcales bacterium HHB-1]
MRAILFPAYMPSLSPEVKKALHADFCAADRLMVILLGFHWLIASTVMAYSYDFYLLGFVGGGVTTGGTYLIYRLFPGTPLSRATIGIGLYALLRHFYPATSWTHRNALPCLDRHGFPYSLQRYSTDSLRHRCDRCPPSHL